MRSGTEIEARWRPPVGNASITLHCYFCGNTANTIDHVPPRACFPDGYAPEGFEFPACEACNQGTKKQDQIFGLYSMLLDFDGSKMRSPEDLEKMSKLRHGIANNYPEALPDEARALPVNRFGSLVTPKPVAVSIPVTPSARDAMEVMSRKLTHALYLREVDRILTTQHRFFGVAYQPQRAGTEALTEFFDSVLPKATVGARGNVRQYGDRFMYKWGAKLPGGFFVYAAQFGRGIVLWGIVIGPQGEIPAVGPLSSMTWLAGACGPGAIAVRPGNKPAEACGGK